MECAKNETVKEVFLTHSKLQMPKAPVTPEARLFSAVKSNQSDVVDQLLSKPGINVNFSDEVRTDALCSSHKCVHNPRCAVF